MRWHVSVQKGSHAGQTHELTHEVERIGSLPQMSIRLTGLPGHALTLQRAEGGYLVINRGCEHLKVGFRRVDQGKKLLWRPGHNLTVNREHVLRLGTGAGSTAAAPVAASFGVNPQSSPVPRNTRSRQLLVIAVLSLVIGSGAYCMNRPQFSDPEAYLEKLLVELHRAPEHNFELRTAERLLRKASLCELRPSDDDRRVAAAALIELRSLINRPSVRLQPQLLRNLQNYIEYRLRVLPV